MSKFRERMREVGEDYHFRIVLVVVALLAALFGFLAGTLTARESRLPIIIETHTGDGR